MFSPIRPIRAMYLGLVLAGCLSPAFAQETKDSPRAGKQAERSERLPRNWGKLNLTDDQRAKVLAIQQKVREKLEAKEMEIEQMSAALQKKRSELLDLRKNVEAERLTVLTEDQKTKLATLEKESREKVKAKKKDTPVSSATESVSPNADPKGAEKGASKPVSKSAKSGNG